MVTENDENTDREVPQAALVVPRFDVDDPRIQTIFANSSVITVENSNVCIYFGTDFVGNERTNRTLSTRVVLTHDSFMRMMEHWFVRYELLATLYKGLPTSLPEIERIDPGRAKEAWENFRKVVFPAEQQSTPADQANSTKSNPSEELAQEVQP